MVAMGTGIRFEFKTSILKVVLKKEVQVIKIYVGLHIAATVEHHSFYQFT